MSGDPEGVDIKMKRISLRIIIILIALLSSGCESAPVPVQSTTPATDTALSGTPTLKITNANFPIPTTSHTIVASLGATETKETIAAYLVNGGGCETPCFLGIYPGKTTQKQLKRILTNNGLPFWNNSNKGIDFYGINYEFKNELSLKGTFTVQNDLVKNLDLGIGLETSEARDVRNWQTFSPATLIGRYGTPSEVTIAMDWGPRSYFEMNVYFKSVDLIVEYAGFELLTSPSKSMVICPLRIPFEDIQIWMGRDPRNPPLEAVSFEKATMLTLEDFSKIMTGTPEQACFTINGESFPWYIDSPN